MKVIELFDRIYSQFGLKYHVELSTKPDNAMGDDAFGKQLQKHCVMLSKQKVLIM